MSTFTNAELQSIVDNLTTRAPKATFNVDGVTYTSSKIVPLAASVLTARSGIKTAKGAWINARTKSAEVEDAANPIIEAVRGMLVSMFIKDTSAQADLGVAPRRGPKPLTAEARLAASAKSRATREVRGTASKKQKAKLKGNVTGVVVTPVTSQGPIVTSPAATPTDATTVPTSASPVATTADPVVATVASTANPVLAAAASTANAVNAALAPTLAPALVAGVTVTPTGH